MCSKNDIFKYFVIYFRLLNTSNYKIKLNYYSEQAGHILWNIVFVYC